VTTLDPAMPMEARGGGKEEKKAPVRRFWSFGIDPDWPVSLTGFNGFVEAIY